MADDPQVNQVLVAILEILRQQTIYIHRLHGWITALAGALDADAEHGSQLKQQPFYDLGPAPEIQRTDLTLQNIDALIQQLRKK